MRKKGETGSHFIGMRFLAVLITIKRKGVYITFLGKHNEVLNYYVIPKETKFAKLMSD
jgi:hypothetical protein